MGWGFVFSALTKGIQAGVDFFGKRKAGAAAMEAGQTEQGMYNKEADIATQQAKDATALGWQAADRQAYRMRTLVGSQAAGFAGQGVSLTGGSAPSRVIGGDYALGAADKFNILENARRKAWGFSQEADVYRTRGNLALMAGENQRSADNLESLGSLANFGGDMWNLYQNRPQG